MTIIEEIRARHKAATPGPWGWQGATTSRSLDLVARHGWRSIVLSFRRWGTQSAQPEFNVDGILRPAATMLITPEDHNPWRVTGIDHPDAIAIAASWGDIDTLLCALDTATEALRHYAVDGDEEIAYDSDGAEIITVNSPGPEIAREALAALAGGGDR